MFAVGTTKKYRNNDIMMRYKRVPTRDTAMNSEITSDSDTDGQTDLDRRAANKNSNRSNDGERLGSGHLDPLQRKLFLGLQIFSLSTALIGLILLCIWIFKYKNGVSFTDAKKMGNLHPLFMYSFLFGLNIYGVLIYRTFYSQDKVKVKWAHAIVAFINIVMAITGVTLMFINHNASGAANMYSLHSWIGAITTTLYVSQFLFGFITFLKPGLSLSVRTNAMPLHRFAGVAILGMAGLAAITGIAEWAIWSIGDNYSKFVPMTFVANFTGACVLISTLVTVYLLSQDRYRRPAASDLPSQLIKSPE